MDIKVLGDGCHGCLQLKLLVGQVLDELGLPTPVRRVSDRKEMDRYLLSEPPALVINGQLVVERRLPTKEELCRWMTDALSWERRAWTT
ncbi:MAG: thioredoxin family protein [Anaerolineales bacterium]|nr:MAG: thioredoxin family protein [Anaerolineales bacterium]